MRIKDNEVLAWTSLGLFVLSLALYLLWATVNNAWSGGWPIYFAIAAMALHAVSCPKNIRIPGYVLFFGLFAFWVVSVAVASYDFGENRVSEDFKIAGGNLGWIAVAAFPVTLYWGFREKREHGQVRPLISALAFFIAGFLFLLLSLSY